MNIFHQTFSCKVISYDFYLNIDYIKFNLHCKKKKKKTFFERKISFEKQNKSPIKLIR